ncbi:hypothetical protein ZWY2020_033774 [Hordeum vulgare]|nr:hypothetical protein ZWY2020_033774 [Hordeum vulgare]
MHHHEVAVSLTNYTLKHSDAGLIIVEGRMDMQHHVCYRHHCLMPAFPLLCSFDKDIHLIQTELLIVG